MLPGTECCSVQRQLRSIATSLHYDLPCHLRVDRAVVGISSRLGKCEGELFVRIPHLGLEHSVGADDRMRYIITVGPSNCSSDRYLEGLRPKTEIVDCNLCVCPCWLVVRRDAR